MASIATVPQITKAEDKSQKRYLYRVYFNPTEGVGFPNIEFANSNLVITVNSGYASGLRGKLDNI